MHPHPCKTHLLIRDICCCWLRPRDPHQLFCSTDKEEKEYLRDSSSCCYRTHHPEGPKPLTGHPKELSIRPSNTATSALEPAAADSSRLHFVHSTAQGMKENARFCSLDGYKRTQVCETKLTTH